MAKSALILLALLANATAFKFLSNFKAASLIPRPSAMLRKRKAVKVFGDKKLAVITGASSGLGLETAAELLQTGKYHVFGAVRDVEKMSRLAKDKGFSSDDFTPLKVDLNSFSSVIDFSKALDKAKLNRPIDRLICNAGVYQSTDAPQWSEDGHPQPLQVNFLSHFLMVSHLLPGMTKAYDPRVIFVGGAVPEESVAVYPRADFGDMAGLKAGAKEPVSMIDGLNYDGAKAYKDSKLCLSLLSNMLHDKYHKQTGIAFSTIYPGAIADSCLLQDKPPLDTSMIGKLREAMGMGDQTVTMAQGAQRLFQAAHDGRCSKSGVHWSWLEGSAAEDASNAAKDDAQVGSGTNIVWSTIYETELSEELSDFKVSQNLWKHASTLTGAQWPKPNQPRSPCPTLVVVGAVTKAMNAKEDAKRTLEGIESDGKGGKVALKPSLGAKVLGGTGFAIDVVASNTIGRAGKLAQEKLLGSMVDEALEGSFQETADMKEGKAALRKLKAGGDGEERAEELTLPDDDGADAQIAKSLQDRISQLEVESGSPS